MTCAKECAPGCSEFVNVGRGLGQFQVSDGNMKEGT